MRTTCLQFRLGSLLMLALAMTLAAWPVAAAHPDARSLILASDPAGTAATRLMDGGVMVVRDLGTHALAVVDRDASDQVADLGLFYDVLDEAIEGKTYYTVVPTRRANLSQLPGTARILHRLYPGAVIETTPEGAEAIAGMGFEIARVFIRPIRRSAREITFTVDRAPAQTDTLIEAMVAAVSSSQINATVQRLEDFETRWAIHDSCQAAANWIHAQFRSFGIDSVYFQKFSELYVDNVVAKIPGKTNPNEIVLIGGHYDSTSPDPYGNAPGADDNASGTACVLECARTLSPYEFDRTIVFVAFGAEEQGLLGSEFYAARAATHGEDIVAMVSVDMIGYVAASDTPDLDIISNSSSGWLRDLAVSTAAAYVAGFPVVDGMLPVGAGSDHVSFWDQGYDAILFFEDTNQYSPWIHSALDVVGTSYNSPALAYGSVRTAVALIADLAGPKPLPTGIANVRPAAPAVTLEQNIPNPFNPRTAIRFHVAPPGARITLTLYDATGRHVRTLADGMHGEGTYVEWWDGRDGTGNAVASGVYICRLKAGPATLTRKLVLVR